MDNKLRVKSHAALRWVITQKSQLVSYAQYFAVCPDTSFSHRMNYLQEERDISPFVVHRFGRYAYFKTSTSVNDPVVKRSKYQYQLDMLEGRVEGTNHVVREVLTVNDIADPELTNATNGEIPSDESRVIIMNEQEIELEREMVLFFDPRCKLQIVVKDIDGYFSFFHQDEVLKTSKKREGNTRIIEEKIISADYLDIPCSDLLETKDSKRAPETQVRGSLTSIREFISEAIAKEFPLISTLTQVTNGGKTNVLHKDLLDLFAPYIEDNCLIKLPKTQFIRIPSA